MLAYRRLLPGVLAFALVQAGAAHAAVYPRIVNGLDTHDFPTTGALLAARGGGPITADNAFTYCSGTLIGCRTFLTAAHCVASDVDPTHYWVYLQNAGTLPVSAVVANPAYTGSAATTSRSSPSRATSRASRRRRSTPPTT